MNKAALALSYMFGTLALIAFMLLSVLPVSYWYAPISAGCVLLLFAFTFRYLAK